jgi:hypothetical protein
MTHLSAPKVPWWLPAPPPYLLTDCTGQIGLIKADHAKVVALLNDIYVGPILRDQEACQVTLISDHLLFLSLDAQLSLEGQETLGHTREREVGLWAWIKLNFMTQGQPREIYAWSPLIMFVDDGLAVQTGREVLGYPKVQAVFTPARDQPNHNPRVVIQCMAVSDLGSPEAKLLPVMTISGDVDYPASDPPSLAELAHTFRATLQIKDGYQEPDVSNGFECVCPRYRQVIEGEKSPDLALILSSISPPIPTSFDQHLYYGLLGRGTAVTLSETISFPLESSLGIKPNTPIKAGFWLYGIAKLNAQAIPL